MHAALGPTDAVVRTRPGSRGRSALACERRAQWVTQGPLGVHPFPLARACIETQGRSRRRCFAGRQRRGAPSPRVRTRVPAHLRSIARESCVRGARCSWECRIPRSPPHTTRMHALGQLQKTLSLRLAQLTAPGRRCSHGLDVFRKVALYICLQVLFSIEQFIANITPQRVCLSCPARVVGVQRIQVA